MAMAFSPAFIAARGTVPTSVSRRHQALKYVAEVLPASGSLACEPLWHRFSGAVAALLAAAPEPAHAFSETDPLPSMCF